MEILLLNVSGLALETAVSGSTVDQHLASDDTHRHTLRENIKQSRLSRTVTCQPGSMDGFQIVYSPRNTHERRKSTRFDPSVNFIEQSAWLLLDLDIVIDGVPMENGSLPLNRGREFTTTALLRIDRLGGDSCVGLGFLVLFRVEVGDAASREQQDLALGPLSRDVLGCQQVGAEEEEHKGDENTKVPVAISTGSEEPGAVPIRTSTDVSDSTRS